jgi:transcriptional regulator with XRE-family HTH domain
MRKARGIEERIRSRLQALGYWKGGRADVGRFCVERGYLPQYVYAWLKGRVPQAEKLIRLAADLEVPPAWLLFGDNGMDGWMGAEVRQFLRPRMNGRDKARAAAP